MTKSQKKPIVPPLTPAEAAGLLERLDQISRAFVGQIDELESALGMMLLGRLFGWKVLVLVHNKRTIRKYESILGIEVRAAFPEVGPLAGKSVGFDVVQKAGQFWKAVSGDIKVPERRDIVP